MYFFFFLFKAYTGHNGGATNTLSSTYPKVTTRPNALMNIVDPATGKNVAEDIYRNAAATPSDEPCTRDTNKSQVRNIFFNIKIYYKKKIVFSMNIIFYFILYY